MLSGKGTTTITLEAGVDDSALLKELMELRKRTGAWPLDFVRGYPKTANLIQLLRAELADPEE